MKVNISGVHVSVQWFIVLLVITLFALLASVVADKLDNPSLSGGIVTAVIVLWLALGIGGAAFCGGMVATRLIEKGAAIGKDRDALNVQREAIAANAARQMADGFRLGYQMTRSLPEQPLLPMNRDDNVLPVLSTWQLLESGDE